MKISIARRAASLALLGATALILAACSSVKLDDVNGDSGSGGVVATSLHNHGMILRVLYMSEVFTLTSMNTPYRLSIKRLCLLMRAI